jgi:hypothetical protein
LCSTSRTQLSDHPLHRGLRATKIIWGFLLTFIPYLIVVASGDAHRTEAATGSASRLLSPNAVE